MIFILLLIASTMAIAGSAAYFSVYGLAATFSGVFWSVVIMGGSLEAGKLVGASYLYRYWNKTNLLLKSYLIAGIVSLMVLTSTGIFGYLSSGYLTDVLPLKQLQEQIKLLESEKTRKIDRKIQIDQQVAQLPTESIKGRERLIRQFRSEQVETSKRINEIEKELLTIKTTQIKTEAHVGPITYVARAFGVETDAATKWLIFLIIFAFDPMAVALTLAVNIALRDREQSLKPVPIEILSPSVEPIVETTPSPTWSSTTVVEPVIEPVVEIPVVEPVVEIPVVEPVVEIPVVEPVVEIPVAVVEATPTSKVSASLLHTITNPSGDFTHPWENNINEASLNELITYYRTLRSKEKIGPLLPAEQNEKYAIENVLKKHDLIRYLED